MYATGFLHKLFHQVLLFLVQLCSRLCSRGLTMQPLEKNDASILQP